MNELIKDEHPLTNWFNRNLGKYVGETKHSNEIDELTEKLGIIISPEMYDEYGEERILEWLKSL